MPAVVRDSAAALLASVARCVFISTISAYRDWPYADSITEESPLFAGDPDHDPGTRAWDPDAYGPRKVGCELALRRSFGPERLLILRPHVILGPHEYVGRLPWWLSRTGRGGRMRAGPVDPAGGCTGSRRVHAHARPPRSGRVFNVAAPPGRETFGRMLEACRAVTGSDAVPVWVDEGWLVQQGVRQWTGLPLWRALPTAWRMDTSRAHPELDRATWRDNPPTPDATHRRQLLNAASREVLRRFAHHDIHPHPTRAAELAARYPGRLAHHALRTPAAHLAAPHEIPVPPSPDLPTQTVLDLGL